MEFQILKALQYNTMFSTPLDFLEIYLDIFANANSSGITLADESKVRIHRCTKGMKYHAFLPVSTSLPAYCVDEQVRNLRP